MGVAVHVPPDAVVSSRIVCSAQSFEQQEPLLLGNKAVVVSNVYRVDVSAREMLKPLQLSIPHSIAVAQLTPEFEMGIAHSATPKFESWEELPSDQYCFTTTRAVLRTKSFSYFAVFVFLSKATETVLRAMGYGIPRDIYVILYGPSQHFLDEWSINVYCFARNSKMTEVIFQMTSFCFCLIKYCFIKLMQTQEKQREPRGRILWGPKTFPSKGTAALDLRVNVNENHVTVDRMAEVR